MKFVLVPVAALLGCLLAAPIQAAAPPDFNRDVRPILSDTCFTCHGPDDAKRKASLRLDVKENALKGGKSGRAALIPGKLETSELIRRLTSSDPEEVMPPPDSGKKITRVQIETLKRWVAAGGEYAAHWAFVPPQKPEPPTVTNSSWARSPLDRFVLARLESENLAPRPEADRATLLRRVALDLTGLPPSLEEVEAFVADARPDAYEQVVERLFRSPRHGERLALEWLDTARYADTHGYHIDSARDMSAWRDWVIAAFNSNQRFDAFTIEQLAGDLLPGATEKQRLASGFNRNHMINYEGGAIPEEYHALYLHDRVNTTATAWLGLTLACAQCHDHKYDPITQRDYYRFYAFFNTIDEQGLDGRYGNAKPLVKLPTPENGAELEKRRTSVKALEAKLDGAWPDVDQEQARWETDFGIKAPAEPILKLLKITALDRTREQQAEIRQYYRKEVSLIAKKTRDELNNTRQKLDEYDRDMPSVMVMGEMAQPRDTFILLRGSYDQKGEKVTPGTPAFLPPLPVGESPTRLTLARWLVSPENPLTARVVVNRYWQMFFGVGLVKSSENFGSQADWPSHPAMLDWLATEFVRSGWDVRALQRLLVTSATYRQRSAAPRDQIREDPENRLLARGPRFRLPAEAVRDLALQVSGLLSPRIGGPSVLPYQPRGMWEELMSREDNDSFTAQKYVQDHGEKLYRRSMYTFWKRTSAPANLSTFDAPDRQVCTVRRPRTNTPLQALVLLNDPTFVEAARHLADRMVAAAVDDRQRIAHAFRLATARAPTEAEVDLLLRLYQSQLARFRGHENEARRLLAVGESALGPVDDPVSLAAWTMVASAILNLDETITKG